MDTQNDAIFEAGDTFKNPSFLVSMLDIGGGYFVCFFRGFFYGFDPYGMKITIKLTTQQSQI